MNKNDTYDDALVYSCLSFQLNIHLPSIPTCGLFVKEGRCWHDSPEHRIIETGWMIADCDQACVGRPCSENGFDVLAIMDMDITEIV